MLTPEQKKRFSKRSAPTIEKAFAALAGNWKLGHWLGPANRYSRECIERLKTDFGPGSYVRRRDLLEYITASVLVHCMDGWSYLGRALGAQLAGDHDSARHLGYYAELRAAMALLGGQGIGVFDKEHIVVNNRGSCLRLPPKRSKNKPKRPNGPGTHQFVWDALKEWVTTPDAKDCILASVKGGGQSLASWLDQFSLMPALTMSLASDWLLSWGLDIQRLTRDRDARNVSSYRPTAFTTTRPASAKESIGFVVRLWGLSEPTADSPFAELDRQLIRSSVRYAFKASHGRTHLHAPSVYEHKVKSLLKWLQPTAVPGIDWEKYFLDQSIDPLDPVNQAAGQAGPESEYHSMQVASRAFLLLRIAAGISERLVSSLPASNRADLGFWIDSVGEDRGLWPSGTRPTNLQDLWKDPEDALNAFNADMPNLGCYSALWQRQSLPTLVLTSCERMGLWGTVG